MFDNSSEPAKAVERRSDPTRNTMPHFVRSDHKSQRLSQILVNKTPVEEGLYEHLESSNKRRKVEVRFTSIKDLSMKTLDAANAGNFCILTRRSYKDIP